MSENTELKKLGQKAYLGYHHDGIIDIILGLCTLGFGIRMAIDSPVFLFMSWVPILFYLPLKNRITVPRYGYVRFTSDRSRAILFSLVIVVGVVFLAFFIGLFVFASGNSIPQIVDQWLKQYHMLLLGGFAALALAGAAVFTGIRRFLGYALLFIAIIAIGIWMELPAPAYVIVLGAIIFLIGLWMLYRFMSSHPIISRE